MQGSLNNLLHIYITQVSAYKRPCNRIYATRISNQYLRYKICINKMPRGVGVKKGLVGVLGVLSLRHPEKSFKV